MANNLNVQSQAIKGENTEAFPILAAALASTATRTSDEFINNNLNGILIAFVTANKAGTPTFALSVETTFDGTNWVTLVTFTAIAANGTALYFVHPHADKTATAKNSLTEEGTIALPRRFRVKLTYAGTPASDKLDTAVYGMLVK